MSDRSSRLFGAGLVVLLPLIATFVQFDSHAIFVGPDAVEHISIANAFADGHGFVNPIQWYFGWPSPPPLPGPASRAPALPLFLAAGLALGADLADLMGAHIVLSTLVALGMYAICCRFLRPGLAATATLLITTSDQWSGFNKTLLTEISAVGALLLVIGTSPGVTRSARGALLCALATIVAWLTRPNLAPIALAVVVAAGWDVQPRRSILRSPLLVYAVALLVGFPTVSWLITHATGLPPYFGYRSAFQNFPATRAFSWGTQYTGTLPFILENIDAIARTCAQHAVASFGALFLQTRLWFAGWFFLLGVLSIACSPRKGTIEERVALLTALGLFTIVVLTYPAFDDGRYLFPPASLSVLVGMGWFEKRLQRLEAGMPRRTQTRTGSAGWALLCLGALLQIGTVPASRPTLRPPPSWGHRISPLCDALQPGALVMTDEPWTVHWACGNPTVRVPADFRDERLGADFLATYAPRYFVTYRRKNQRWAGRDPRMTHLGSIPKVRLFEIASDAGIPTVPPGRPIRPPQCLTGSKVRRCAPGPG